MYLCAQILQDQCLLLVLSQEGGNLHLPLVSLLAGEQGVEIALGEQDGV